ncbi:MAG: hypothetical protein LAT56_04830 [Wenzhouxiangella sp.]|nr:hypothetical protein [Wenzhouxiangella sp.]
MLRLTASERISISLSIITRIGPESDTSVARMMVDAMPSALAWAIAQLSVPVWLPSPGSLAVVT